MTEPTFEPTVEEAAFRICDDDAVNWYLRKLANIASEKARIETQAARMVAVLDADAERLEYLFGSQMEAYCKQKMQESKRKRKTLDFFQGRVQFRTVPAAVVITDQNAALEYARRHVQTAVRVEERLNADEYRRIAQDVLGDGTTLPGTDRRPEKEAFSISFPK